MRFQCTRCVSGQIRASDFIVVLAKTTSIAHLFSRHPKRLGLDAIAGNLDLLPILQSISPSQIDRLNWKLRGKFASTWFAGMCRSMQGVQPYPICTPLMRRWSFPSNTRDGQADECFVFVRIRRSQFSHCGRRSRILDLATTMRGFDKTFSLPCIKAPSSHQGLKELPLYWNCLVWQKCHIRSGKATPS